MKTKDRKRSIEFWFNERSGLIVITLNFETEQDREILKRGLASLRKGKYEAIQSLFFPKKKSG